MSERKSLLTSISSALGVEFFSSVATTLRITGWHEKRGTEDHNERREETRREEART